MTKSSNPMELPPGWYVIGEPQEFKSGKPNALRRLGMDWVIWRNSQGKWILQHDRCPHRSARFSAGYLKGDCVVCPFHGFEFNAQGACTFAPEIKRDAPGLKIESHPLTIAHGFLWLNWGDFKGEIPWFEGLPPSHQGSHTTAEWNQHITRCVENQLDYAHLPFVHAKTIGRFSDPSIKPTIHQDATGLKVVFDESRKSFFEFRFPNIWRLGIAPKFMLTLCFVPVDEDNTKFYLRAYQGFVSLPVLREAIGLVMRWTNRKILAEDHGVVIGQLPKDVRDVNLNERLFPSDAAIQIYRRWLAGNAH